jgi:hypothetical protein
MNKVIVKKDFKGYSAYTLDNEGYKTYFNPRNQYKDLKKSIEDYFKEINKKYIIVINYDLKK